MDDDKQNARISSVTLETGKPTQFNFNRPVKFRMEFAQGSYIEGLIPANFGLTVCNQGDVVGFNVIIDDESVAGLGVVE